MCKAKILFGVHNDQYNIDIYDDMSVNIYDHVNDLSVTDFDAETVALFVALLKRDGHLNRLLKINNDRIRGLGIKDKKLLKELIIE